MSIQLTQEQTCEILTSTINTWKHPPSGTSPYFHNETWYAECFLNYFLQIKDDTHNFVSLITGQFQKAFDLSFSRICKTLELHRVDGTKIFEIVSEERFILRSDRSAYNRQVPGKSPKGLKAEPWMEYNHWLLANRYWQGFLLSQQPDFKITVPDDSVGPLDLFLAVETKPLWGMRIKALESGTYYIGDDGDCIDVHPHAHFHTYFSSPNENPTRR